MEQDAKPVALISGGSRGIGRAVVKRLAAEGHDISFCYQSNSDAAISLEKELGELGVQVLARKVDVASADEVRAWVAETQETLGTVDVAVTAAGITRDNLLFKMPVDDWDAVMNVHLRGAFLMTKAAQKHMTEAKFGRIVNLSSTSALDAVPPASAAIEPSSTPMVSAMIVAPSATSIDTRPP